MSFPFTHQAGGRERRDGDLREGVAQKAAGRAREVSATRGDVATLA